MKTLTMTALATALLVATAPALAGRDTIQIQQIEKAVAAKRAAQMELAKQQQQQVQSGLAGAVGQPGKVGPTTEDKRFSRAGRLFLFDHP